MHLVSITRNPTPSGAVFGMFKGYDGEPLRFARWEATVGERRGTMCVFTGYSEYIEKYFETVSDLRRRGFAVAIMDWRGHGESYRPINDPRKGHIDDFAEYEQDIAYYMRDIVLPDCPPPYNALAHSMGGHIILRNIAQPGSWFDRVVLCAPMVEMHPSTLRFPVQVVRAYCAIAMTLGLQHNCVLDDTPDGGALRDFDANQATSDWERYQRNYMLEQAAGQLRLGSPTIGWLNAALKSIAMINHPDYFAKVNVPSLIFAAGMDTLVPSQSVEDYAARLKSATGVRLSESKHEILQENDSIRTRFWAAFDAYFDLEKA